MLRRSRTTKKLAKRIDLQYFTRPHVFRRWRFWLSVAVPVIALGWFVTQRAQGGQKVYSSGTTGRVARGIHAAVQSLPRRPRRQLQPRRSATRPASPAMTPPCITRIRLSLPNVHRAMSNTKAPMLFSHRGPSCSQCHADLRTRDGQPHYISSIAGFDRKHPEFSTLRSGKTDPGGVRLNHYLHLQPNLIGPNNTRMQLICDDCHGAKSADVAPHRAELNPTSLSEISTRHPHEQAYMPPPEFAKHCAACHTLQFDTHFGNEQVPHDKPEGIHTFLVKKFGEYIATHPGAVHEVNPPDRQIPERVRQARSARNAAEWVQFRVEDAESLLYAKTCKQCHTLRPTSDSLPEVAKSNMTTRWLSHADFDHHPHRMMTCTRCHSRTPDSRETTDVLLPGIQTCQQCHRPQGSTKEAAEGRCFECHQYHDWTKTKPTKGDFTIQQLRGEARVPVLDR